MSDVRWQQPWMERAACLDADPELFHYVEGERGGEARRRELEAKAVCAGCEVVAKCLEYALAIELPSGRSGVWGGLTAEERTAAVSGKPAPSPTLPVKREKRETTRKHGTWSRYIHGCRCEDCRRACREHSQAARERRRAS